MGLHKFDDDTVKLAREILDFVLFRLEEDPPALGSTKSPQELLPLFKDVITAKGLGGEKAFDFFKQVVEPATISTDHPRYLAFVTNAPANAASLFDVVVSACSMYGGTWLEGAGVVAAENQALRYIMDVIGYEQSAAGVFVSGGTAANLSALIAARHWFRRVNPNMERERLAIACAPSAHSSIRHAAMAMDVDIFNVEGDEFNRLTASNLQKALDELSPSDRSRIFAIAATAGATNTGYVDDLKHTGKIAWDNEIWFHVDGAYGGAAMLCDETASLFDGVIQADSFVVDPHKWLFSPYDCAALIYKDPLDARLAHSQHAEYLDPVTDTQEFNPSDYAHHLTRRARGLPLWFTLAVHGTDAFKQAITTCIDTTKAGATYIEGCSHVELAIEPQLSVLLIRRKNWNSEQYYSWCDAMLEKEYAFVVPTSVNGETLLRLCITNPTTTLDDLKLIIDAMA
ncbi:MAG: aminotransferase class V-fold PLP-dependent enzyme [Acidimicrobiia bacterium]